MDITSSVLGKWLGDKWGIENHGVMDMFKVDKANKTIDFTLKLKNQENPFDIKIQYSLEAQDDKNVLKLTPAAGSPDWLTKIIPFDKPIELPTMVYQAAKAFL